MADQRIEDMFKALLARLDESLKPAGFRKRGKSWRRLSGGNCALVEVQRSLGSTAASIRFTLNLAVFSGRLLDQDELDLGKAGVWDAHLRCRIGDFLSPAGDRWWTLAADADVAALMQEIGEPLRAGIAFLAAHDTDAALVRLWEAGSSPGITGYQRQQNLDRLRAEG